MNILLISLLLYMIYALILSKNYKYTDHVQTKEELVQVLNINLSIEEMEELVVALEEENKLKACHYDILEIAYGVRQSKLVFDLKDTLGFVLIDLGYARQVGNDYELV